MKPCWKSVLIYLPLPEGIKRKVITELYEEADTLSRILTPFTTILHMHEALFGVLETWGALQVSRGVPIPVPCPICLRFNNEKTQIRFTFNVYKQGVPSLYPTDKALQCDKGHWFILYDPENLYYKPFLYEILKLYLDKPEEFERDINLQCLIPPEFRTPEKIGKLVKFFPYLPGKSELKIAAKALEVINKFRDACHPYISGWEDLHYVLPAIKETLPAFKLALYKIYSLKTLPSIINLLRRGLKESGLGSPTRDYQPDWTED